MSIPTEQLPLIATAYTTIYEDIKAQDAAMQKNMERYAKAILEADNTYQAMATACYHLNLILDEMASRNLI